MNECPISYCSNRLERAETMVCTPCIRRCPRPLRRDVWLANNDPTALGAVDGVDSPVIDRVFSSVVQYLENNPRGESRRRGRPHRR